MPDESHALPLQVDIVSDVVCPWCIIGYKQLMKALGSLPGEFDLALCWHRTRFGKRHAACFGWSEAL